MATARLPDVREHVRGFFPGVASDSAVVGGDADGCPQLGGHRQHWQHHIDGAYLDVGEVNLEGGLEGEFADDEEGNSTSELTPPESEGYSDGGIGK